MYVCLYVCLYVLVCISRTSPVIVMKLGRYKGQVCATVCGEFGDAGGSGAAGRER